MTGGQALRRMMWQSEQDGVEARSTVRMATRAEGSWEEGGGTYETDSRSFRQLAGPVCSWPTYPVAVTNLTPTWAWALQETP